jgi:hypothetical protein
MAVSGTALAAEPINLQINGKNLPTEVAPVIRDNRTLVPVRVISESLGADVNWDSTNKKVTIVKNDKQLELTIGKKEVLSNGQALPALEVAPQIINGSTMVPVRVVSEALGADVKWDQATRTVVTTFSEKKDSMTPEELMVKSNEAMQKYETYKYTGSGEVKMDLPGAPSNLTIKTDMEGSFKRTGTKNELYQVQTIDVPAVAGGKQVPQKIEMYTDGSQFYTKMAGKDWEKLDLGFDLSSLMNNQDPQKAMQMLKDFGLIVSYGNDTKIDGKDYYTLVVKVDSKKYLAAVKDMTAKLIPAGEADAQKVFDELMNNLKIDMSEKIFIAKDTFVMTKLVLDGKISMIAQGATINEKIKFDMNLNGFGEPVTMPQITK